MKLLIITQKVDRNDPILGFFHRWVEEFAKHYQQIIVICLGEGKYNLPENVKVLSLGKEKLKAKSYKLQALKKFQYVVNFFKYIWQERKNYDTVFVHMNQEYVLVGGVPWLLLGKKVFLWRNHHTGNWLTDLAAMFCSKVFCTSKYSYTAKYKKTVLMPVGIDIEKFQPRSYNLKANNSILFLGRIAPSKNVNIFVEALGLLKKEGIIFLADIYGDALPKDSMYFEKLKSRTRELGLDDILKFHIGVPNYKTPEIYNAHEIYVNLSSSGMYDKTIFEAMACGCLALASNDNLKGQIDGRLIINKREAQEVADRLMWALSLPQEEKKRMIQEEITLTKVHSLQMLSTKLLHEISSAIVLPYAKLLKYILSGGTAATVDLGFLFLFTSIFHIWYIMSAVLAFLIAFSISFFLNKFWTFSDLDTKRWKSQMFKYFSIMVINLGINTFLMYIFVDHLNLHYFIAQIVAGALVACESFFVYQKFVFRVSNKI